MGGKTRGKQGVRVRPVIVKHAPVDDRIKMAARVGTLECQVARADRDKETAVIAAVEGMHAKVARLQSEIEILANADVQDRMDGVSGVIGNCEGMLLDAIDKIKADLKRHLDAAVLEIVGAAQQRDEAVLDAQAAAQACGDAHTALAQRVQELQGMLAAREGQLAAAVQERDLAVQTLEKLVMKDGVAPLWIMREYVALASMQDGKIKQLRTRDFVDSVIKWTWRQIQQVQSKGQKIQPAEDAPTADADPNAGGDAIHPDPEINAEILEDKADGDAVDREAGLPTDDDVPVNDGSGFPPDEVKADPKVLPPEGHEDLCGGCSCDTPAGCGISPSCLANDRPAGVNAHCPILANM